MTPPAISRRVRALPLAFLAAWACSSSKTQLFDEASGSAAFAIAVDADVTALDYVVKDSSGDVVKSESMNPASGSAIRFSLDLHAASGYSIVLSAQTADGQSCS